MAPLDYDKKSIIRSDVQSEKNAALDSLSWVGMEAIQGALLIPGAASALSQNLSVVQVPVQASMGVNLFSGNRGIHMSRLYQNFLATLNGQTLSLDRMKDFLMISLASHEALSSEATIELKFNFAKAVSSLKSGLLGYRQYPIILAMKKTLDGGVKLSVEVEIIYSSTCPQSAGLATEILNQHLNNQQFLTSMKSGTQNQQESKLSEVMNLDRLPATPHAQRSVMQIKTKFVESHNTNSSALTFDICDYVNDLIDEVEAALGTAVQTTVKKADEMYFAQLNADNLMFCEDAVRKVASHLTSLKKQQKMGFVSVNEIQMKTRHEESLHPHNAVAQMQVKFSDGV